MRLQSVVSARALTTAKARSSWDGRSATARGKSGYPCKVLAIGYCKNGTIAALDETEEHGNEQCELKCGDTFADLTIFIAVAAGRDG